MKSQNIEIPANQLDGTKTALRHLLDERTSAPCASYSDEDLQQDDQDYEDIDKIKTVLDVFTFLRDQGGQECFVEYASCLDPLGGFKVEGKGWPDAEDEDAFRNYLTTTYGIPKKDFP
jgi:hypothetical protein